jgi:hypothetical protein
MASHSIVPANDDKKKHMIRARVGVSHPAAWYSNGSVTIVAPIELLSCKQNEPARDIFLAPKAFLILRGVRLISSALSSIDHRSGQIVQGFAVRLI